MSEVLPKKRIRRGIDKDREDERESLLDRPRVYNQHSSGPTAKKNPSRILPDHPGFQVLTTSEINCDEISIGNDSLMALAPPPEKSRYEINRDKEKEKFSTGLVKRSIRPPCAPESTLHKKMQRYYQWVNNPSIIGEDLQSYKSVVDKLYTELQELEIEAIRWNSCVNTLRAEFSNIDSSLTCQILEQESLERKLIALLLQENAAVEEIVKGDSHVTRGKAALSAADVASKLALFDSELTGRLEACISLCKMQNDGGKSSESELRVVTDPANGEVLACAYKAKKKDITHDDSKSTNIHLTETRMEVDEAGGKVTELHKAESVTTTSHLPLPSKEPNTSSGSENIMTQVDKIPDLPAIVAYVEEKKRKIHETKAVDNFSETLHQKNGRMYTLNMPDEIDRPHNYFKVKKVPSVGALVGDRQHSELEAQTAALKYATSPLSDYVSLLQGPQETTTVDKTGLNDGPDVERGVTSAKGRNRGGKVTSSGPSPAVDGVIAMHMNALRRTPCEVPLFISPFSALEGNYAGTYEPLKFPCQESNQGTAATVAGHNLSDHEHYLHPKFIVAGEKYIADINTLTSAVLRARIELADLEKEETEWRSQVNSSRAALLKAQEALSVVEQNCQGGAQVYCAQTEAELTVNSGETVLIGENGAATDSPANEQDGVLGLIGMSTGSANGAPNGNAQAAKKANDNKKNSSKKKSASRKRR